MAPVSAQTAYDEILVHIRQRGAAFGMWRVGVAPDALRHMLGQQRAALNRAACIYRTCTTPLAARSVEQALLDLGCEGPGTAEPSSAIQVYAYLLSPSSNS